MSSPKPIRLASLPSLAWELSINDIPTFVLPNTAFGIVSALAAPALTECAQSARIGPLLVYCTPRILLFNWTNLLVFNLANQRLAESIEEDKLNKPWRLLARGEISTTQATRLLLGAVPGVLAVNAALGVARESAGILLLAWMYNDLRGGDELTRDPIIAIAYTIFNVSSLRIALAPGDVEFTGTGYCWLGMIAGMILTTMQVQDLKDQRGDQARGRKTWPLVVGDRLSRWWIAGAIMMWSLASVAFWRLSVDKAVGVGLLGAWVASRVLLKTGDDEAWRWWCLWQVALYTLPVWNMWM